MSFELPQVEQTIGEVRFRITKLPYKISRSIFLLVSSKALPSVREGLGGIAKDASRMDVVQAIVGGLSGIIDRLSEADLEKLDEAFGKHSEYLAGEDERGDERWVRLDEKGRMMLFGGGQMALYTRWIVTCVQVNYSDFFAALKTDVLDRVS